MSDKPDRIEESSEFDYYYCVPLRFNPKTSEYYKAIPGKYTDAYEKVHRGVARVKHNNE